MIYDPEMARWPAMVTGHTNDRRRDHREEGRREIGPHRHPLAIDLVDYVEESRTPDITRHLRLCRSCRQGVWNICDNDEVRRELFVDVFARRPDLGDSES